MCQAEIIKFLEKKKGFVYGYEIEQALKVKVNNSLRRLTKYGEVIRKEAILTKGKNCHYHCYKYKLVK